jgi:hypothetical protein
LENIKNTLITDPVGAALDLSAVTGIGGSVSGAMGAPRVANALSTVSSATNPFNAIGAVAKPIASAAGKAWNEAAGGLTHTGAESFAQAAKQGYAGNPDYWANLTGTEAKAEVVAKARDALQTIRQTRLSDYKSGIAETAADAKTLDFAPVDKALNDVIDSMKFKNAGAEKLKIGEVEAAKIGELENVVEQWRMDPRLHTPSGMDALKQRIDAIYPDSPKQTQAQRAITTVRNAVKDEIVKQVPSYAQTMADYETSLALERELTKTLSLGDKTSLDTAMRKLQSLTRNNVATNYGNRLDLVNAMQDLTGQDIMGSLAGQAHNAWLPRGIGGQMGAGGTVLTAIASGHPELAALLLPQSPRLMGGLTYQGARAFGAAARGANALGMSSKNASLAALMAAEADRQRQESK